MKWRTNESLNYPKLSIEATSNLLNHSLAAPLMVAGKGPHITLSDVC